MKRKEPPVGPRAGPKLCLKPSINIVLPTEILRLVLGFAATSAKAFYSLSFVCKLWQSIVVVHRKWRDPRFKDENDLPVCYNWQYRHPSDHHRPDICFSIGRPALYAWSEERIRKIHLYAELQKIGKVRLLVCKNCMPQLCSTCHVNRVGHSNVFNLTKCGHLMCAKCQNKHIFWHPSDGIDACPECEFCSHCNELFRKTYDDADNLLICHNPQDGYHKACKACAKTVVCNGCQKRFCCVYCYEKHHHQCRDCCGGECPKTIGDCRACRHSYAGNVSLIMRAGAANVLEINKRVCHPRLVSLIPSSLSLPDN